MTLFPRGVRDRVRPVAAADYFLRNRLLAWFSTRIIGILPIRRSGNPGDPDPIAQLAERLDQGDIIIFFPEGTRGEPERLAEFKSGLARLKQQRPAVPVIPVFLHGLGKALPKGEAMLVPFFVDVFVNNPVAWTGDRDSYLSAFRTAMSDLAAEGNFPEWQ
jgi:1-acyl-sn-glycerol-3-phosphate acyltransferase